MLSPGSEHGRLSTAAHEDEAPVTDGHGPVWGAGRQDPKPGRHACTHTLRQAAHSPPAPWCLLPLSLLAKGSGQFSSVTQSCLTPCNPMDCSTPGLPTYHRLPEITQTHVHGAGDAIQPPLSSPFPPGRNLSQHQGLFQCVSSLHQVDKVTKGSPPTVSRLWAKPAGSGIAASALYVWDGLPLGGEVLPLIPDKKHQVGRQRGSKAQKSCCRESWRRDRSL